MLDIYTESDKAHKLCLIEFFSGHKKVLEILKYHNLLFKISSFQLRIDESEHKRFKNTLSSSTLFIKDSNLRAESQIQMYIMSFLRAVK